MIRILAVILAAVALPAGQIQAASVSGAIIDAESKAPLEMVNVWLLGTDHGSTTDESGYYLIENVPAGKYQIRFSHIGKVTILKWLVVPEVTEKNFSLTLNFELEEDLIIAPGVSVFADYLVAGGRVDGAATVIGYQEVRDQRALGTEELLRRVPGVTVAGDDGTSNRLNIGIRGLYPRRASRVLILEDGAPIQPAPYLAPATYYNPPAERIDMIEVVKGSSTLTFGPHTMGGVVNYITKQPPAVQRASLSLSGGENGFASTYLKFGGTYDGVGVDLQLLYKNFDGFRNNTASDVYSAVAKLVWAKSSRSIFGAKINLHAENTQATYSALTKYEFETAPKTNRFKDDFLDTERLALDLTHRYQFSANTTLQTQGFFSNFTRDWWRENSTTAAATTEFSDAGADDLIRIGQGNNRARLREFKVIGLRSDISHHYTAFAMPHRLHFGARIEADKFWNRELDGQTADARDGTLARDEYFRAVALAGFARNRFQISQTLSVTPGFRVETFEQLKEARDTQTGTATLTRKRTTEFLPGLSAKLSFKNVELFTGAHRGFTPPTDKTAFLSRTDVVQNFDSDGDLDSELSWNYELGARADFGGWLRLEPTLFLMNIENLVAAGRNANFENLGQVRYRGLELGARARISRLVNLPFSAELQMQWTALDTEINRGVISEQGFATDNDISGNEAPYAPNNTLRIGATLGFRGDRLRVSGAYNYIGQQFSDFNNTVAETEAGDNGILPAYHFINLSVSYKLSRRGMSAYVAVKNLENKIYRASRLHRGSSGIFPGGFRQINAGISLPLSGSI